MAEDSPTEQEVALTTTGRVVDCKYPIIQCILSIQFTYVRGSVCVVNNTVVVTGITV